jgi:hypothetical protein
MALQKRDAKELPFCSFSVTRICGSPVRFAVLRVFPVSSPKSPVLSGMPFNSWSRGAEFAKISMAMEFSISKQFNCSLLSFQTYEKGNQGLGREEYFFITKKGIFLST